MAAGGVGLMVRRCSSCLWLFLGKNNIIISAINILLSFIIKRLYIFKVQIELVKMGKKVIKQLDVYIHTLMQYPQRSNLNNNQLCNYTSYTLYKKKI